MCLLGHCQTEDIGPIPGWCLSESFEFGPGQATDIGLPDDCSGSQAQSCLLILLLRTAAAGWTICSTADCCCFISPATLACLFRLLLWHLLNFSFVPSVAGWCSIFAMAPCYSGQMEKHSLVHEVAESSGPGYVWSIASHASAGRLISWSNLTQRVTKSTSYA